MTPITIINISLITFKFPQGSSEVLKARIQTQLTWCTLWLCRYRATPAPSPAPAQPQLRVERCLPFLLLLIQSIWPLFTEPLLCAKDWGHSATWKAESGGVTPSPCCTGEGQLASLPLSASCHRSQSLPVAPVGRPG
jgi:hypothetical protein